MIKGKKRRNLLVLSCVRKCKKVNDKIIQFSVQSSCVRNAEMSLHERVIVVISFLTRKVFMFSIFLKNKIFLEFLHLFVVNV